MGGEVALVLLLVAAAAESLMLDNDATNEVREAATAARLSDGEVAIVVRGGTAVQGRREALLRAVGPDNSAIALYYHQKTERVTLESTVDGDLATVTWEVRRPHAGTLVLVVSSRSVLLHAGCKRLSKHAAPAERDLLRLLSHHTLRLFHEEDAPIEVYSTEEASLDALGCESSEPEQPAKKEETQVESDMVEVEDLLKKQKEDSRKKRQDEPRSVDEYVNNYIAQHHHEEHRGDQPSRGFESCDDALIRELIRLRQTIDALRGDLANQRAEIEALRAKQDQCCAPREPERPRCTSGSCYPGY